MNKDGNKEQPSEYWLYCSDYSDGLCMLTVNSINSKAHSVGSNTWRFSTPYEPPIHSGINIFQVPLSRH